MNAWRWFLLLPLLISAFVLEYKPVSAALAGLNAPGADNCVVFLTPVLPGETESKASDLYCFSTEDEALAAIPELSSQLDPFLPGLTMESAESVGLTPEVCYQNGKIGQHWENANLAGASMIGWSYECWEPRCDDGSRFLYGIIDGAWNDRISSARAFGGCQARHWAHQDFGAPVVSCNDTCWSMGPVDNATSSISYKPWWE